MYAMLRIVQMRNEDRKKGAEHSGMEWNKIQIYTICQKIVYFAKQRNLTMY